MDSNTPKPPSMRSPNKRLRQALGPFQVLDWRLRDEENQRLSTVV